MKRWIGSGADEDIESAYTSKASLWCTHVQGFSVVYTSKASLYTSKASLWCTRPKPHVYRFLSVARSKKSNRPWRFRLLLYVRTNSDQSIWIWSIDSSRWMLTVVDLSRRFRTAGSGASFARAHMCAHTVDEDFEEKVWTRYELRCGHWRESVRCTAGVTANGATVNVKWTGDVSDEPENYYCDNTIPDSLSLPTSLEQLTFGYGNFLSLYTFYAMMKNNNFTDLKECYLYLYS